MGDFNSFLLGRSQTIPLGEKSRRQDHCREEGETIFLEGRDLSLSVGSRERGFIKG